MSSEKDQSDDQDPRQPNDKVVDKGHDNLLADARELAQWVLSNPVSDKTKEQYRRALMRLEDANQEPLEYCQVRGLSKSSYFLYKAAAQHQYAIYIMAAVRKADKARKNGDDIARIKAERCILVMTEWLRKYDPDYDKLNKPLRPDDPPGKDCEYKRSGKRTKSKRRTLPKAEHWQAQVIDKMTKQWRNAARVEILTGCRPSELQKGVELKRNDAGDLVLKIYGAKVTKNAGQPWREITVSAEDPVAAELLAQLPSVVRIEKLNSYQKALTRAGERCGFKGITGYSFRHQVASDLKSQGVGSEQIGQILGHATTKMQQKYGQSQSGKGGNGIKATAAARDVTSNHRPGPQPSDNQNNGPSL